jgi:hypothetical protein
MHDPKDDDRLAATKAAAASAACNVANVRAELAALYQTGAPAAAAVTAAKAGSARVAVLGDRMANVVPTPSPKASKWSPTPPALKPSLKRS